jgi:hypothetical protein
MQLVKLTSHKPARLVTAILMLASLVLGGINITAVGAVDSCGYTIANSAAFPRGAQVFNESAVLKSFQVIGTGQDARIIAWYSDEHALTLGDSSSTPFVGEYNKPGTSTTVLEAGDSTKATGLTVGSLASTDPANRPFAPVLFLTDITAGGAANTPQSGDWQAGALHNTTAFTPSAVYGTWKQDNGSDPAKNNWFLGPNADPVPAGLKDEGYGAEIVWNASDLGTIQDGHTYKVQFMVHDGDQNNSGGDVGEGCNTFTLPKIPSSLITSPSASTNDANADGGFEIKVSKGSSVVDHVFVSGGAGKPTPTGTATVSIFGPGDTTCSTPLALFPGGATTSVVTLDNTGHGVSAAAGPLNSFGTYTFRYVYSGDATYLGYTEACGLEKVHPVDARITITPGTGINIVGSAHLLTATIKTSEDGVTYATAVNGAVVNWNLPNQVGGPITFVGGVSQCTTNSSGTCTVSINSANVGHTDIHATSTFNQVGVGGNAFTRATGDGQSGDSADANKIYINPNTTLTVADRLTGLDASMNGSVTYTAFTNSSCSGGGTDLTPTNAAVTNGVAPLSKTIDVAPGTTLYFSAHFSNSTTDYTTPCTKETASSQN